MLQYLIKYLNNKQMADQSTCNHTYFYSYMYKKRMCWRAQNLNTSLHVNNMLYYQYS